MEALLNWDGNMLIYIQEYIRNPILTPFFTFITSLGDAGMIWIVFTLILLFIKKTRKVGIMSFCALILSLIVNTLILKNMFDRIRPYEVVEGLVLLSERPHDFSFPSGHTASSFAAAIVMLRNLPRKYGVPALILAVLIGFSRLYVGVHYPTDVLVGMLNGIILGIVGEIIVKRVCDKKK